MFGEMFTRPFSWFVDVHGNVRTHAKELCRYCKIIPGQLLVFVLKLIACCRNALYGAQSSFWIRGVNPPFCILFSFPFLQRLLLSTLILAFFSAFCRLCMPEIDRLGIWMWKARCENNFRIILTMFLTLFSRLLILGKISLHHYGSRKQGRTWICRKQKTGLLSEANWTFFFAFRNR